jgi:hypothetical protein
VAEPILFRDCHGSGLNLICLRIAAHLVFAARRSIEINALRYGDAVLPKLHFVLDEHELFSFVEQLALRWLFPASGSGQLCKA